MSLSLSQASGILRTCVQTLPSSTLSTLLNVSSRAKLAAPCFVTRNYAVAAATPKKGKVGSATGGKIKEFPVETDTNKLVNYCCGLNYIIDSEEVKLKPDNEYPDWLYEIHVGKPKKLSELDPNSKLYWETVRKHAMARNIRMHRYRTKVLKQFK